MINPHTGFHKYTHTHSADWSEEEEHKYSCKKRHLRAVSMRFLIVKALTATMVQISGKIFIVWSLGCVIKVLSAYSTMQLIDSNLTRCKAAVFNTSMACKQKNQSIVWDGNKSLFFQRCSYLWSKLLPSLSGSAPQPEQCLTRPVVLDMPASVCTFNNSLLN